MSAGFLSFLLKLFTDWSLWIHGLVSSLQEHRSHHLHSVSSVEDHSRQLKHESLHRFFCLTKLYLLFRVGWVVLHHFWVKPSRRPWPTSQQSIMTLMRSTSATPASWPRTSYAVCWSRIPSRNLPISFFVIEQRILAHHFLTGNMCFCRKRMTIDDSLQHSWIKVGVIYCTHSQIICRSLWLIWNSVQLTYIYKHLRWLLSFSIK